MKNEEISKYFETNYFRWQMANGRVPLDRFAEHLEISRGYLSQLMNGDKSNIGKNTAIAICRKLNDYSLLDILGYARPREVEVPLDYLPEEYRTRLRGALIELENTFRMRSIQPDSPEGVELSETVLKKFGLSVTFTDKDG